MAQRYTCYKSGECPTCPAYDSKARPVQRRSNVRKVRVAGKCLVNGAYLRLGGCELACSRREEAKAV